MAVSGVSLLTFLVLKGLLFEQTLQASLGHESSLGVKCPNCPPGYQHNQTCEDELVGQVGCVACIQGKTYRTFEDFKDSDNTCKTCLDCNLFNRQTKFKCRTVVDAVCGDCMDGYSDPGEEIFDGLPTVCEKLPPDNKANEEGKEDGSPKETEGKIVEDAVNFRLLVIILAVACCVLLLTTIYLLARCFCKPALPLVASSSDNIIKEMSPLIHTADADDAKSIDNPPPLPLTKATSVSAMEGAQESELREGRGEISGKKNQLSGSELQNHSGITMDSTKVNKQGDDELSSHSMGTSGYSSHGPLMGDSMGLNEANPSVSGQADHQDGTQGKDHSIKVNTSEVQGRCVGQSQASHSQPACPCHAGHVCNNINITITGCPSRSGLPDPSSDERREKVPRDPEGSDEEETAPKEPPRTNCTTACSAQDRAETHPLQESKGVEPYPVLNTEQHPQL